MMYQSLINSGKKLALLIDPDKTNINLAGIIAQEAQKAGVDFILIGGSLLSESIDAIALAIKENTNLPLILFPGSYMQITPNVDGILLLSLISGRNSEFLIGNHVAAAQFLKRSKLEILPTGYILIDGGKPTSVEYISNTKPIPNDKTDIVVATAIAGEMLGLKLIYLEAGSGALIPVSEKTISCVKENISIPLIVGGGISSPEMAYKACVAGADIVVIGSAFENNFSQMKLFANAVHFC